MEYTHNIGILGEKGRGKDVKEILLMLGGIDNNEVDSFFEDDGKVYALDSGDKIISYRYSFKGVLHKIYTIDDFWREYPFKVGDIVKRYKDASWVTTIIGVREVDGRIGYRFTNGGVNNYIATANELTKVEDVTGQLYGQYRDMLIKLSKILTDEHSIQCIKYLVGSLEFIGRKEYIL